MTKRTRTLWSVAVSVCFALIVVVGLGTCIAKSGHPAYEMRTVTLPDGTQVPCLVYHEGSGQAAVGGMSCDWSRTVAP